MIAKGNWILGALLLYSVPCFGEQGSATAEYLFGIALQMQRMVQTLPDEEEAPSETQSFASYLNTQRGAAPIRSKMKRKTKAPVSTTVESEEILDLSKLPRNVVQSIRNPAPQKTQARTQKKRVRSGSRLLDILRKSPPRPVSQLTVRRTLNQMNQKVAEIRGSTQNRPLRIAQPKSIRLDLKTYSPANTAPRRHKKNSGKTHKRALAR